MEDELAGLFEQLYFEDVDTPAENFWKMSMLELSTTKYELEKELEARGELMHQWTPVGRELAARRAAVEVVIKNKTFGNRRDTSLG